MEEKNTKNEISKKVKSISVLVLALLLGVICLFLNTQPENITSFLGKSMELKGSYVIEVEDEYLPGLFVSYEYVYDESNYSISHCNVVIYGVQMGNIPAELEQQGWKFGFVAGNYGICKTYNENISEMITLPERIDSAHVNVNKIGNIALGEIYLNKTSTYIELGKTDSLIATILPENATNKNVTWTSSNPEVVSINENGKIIANKIGNSNIIVTTEEGNKTVNCEVKVYGNQERQGDFYITYIYEIFENVIVKCKVIVQGPITTVPSGWIQEERNEIYKEFNNNEEEVIVADEIGNKVNICVNRIGYVTLSEISLNKGMTILEVGEKEKLISTLLPENATNKNVIWTSSNPEVVRVSENGEITANNPGNATVIVTTEEGNKTASCEVKVVKLDITGIAEEATEISVKEEKYINIKPHNIEMSERNDIWVDVRINGDLYQTMSLNELMYEDKNDSYILALRNLQGNGRITLDIRFNTGIIEEKTIDTKFILKDSIAGIEVTAPTSTQVYNHGTEELDMTGAKIKVTYESGKIEEIEATADMLVKQGTEEKINKVPSPSAYDETNKEVQNVTLKYEKDGKTGSADYEITVINNIVTIAVTQMPKTEYKCGETLDLTNGVITVTRAIARSQNMAIPMNNPNVKVTGFDSSVIKDNMELTVEYTENGITKSTTYTVNVKDTVKDIEVTAPIKTQYKYGEEIDLTGGKVQLIYESGIKSEPINLTREMIKGFDKFKIGKQTITVEYRGQKATFEVNVLEEELTIMSEIYIIGQNKINKIQPDTNVKLFKENIITNAKKIKIYDKNNNEIKEEELIETGMKLILNDKIEFTLIVVGDVDGNGKSNILDIFEVNKYRLSRVQLVEEYLLAGDVNGDNAVNIFDIFEMNKFRLGRILEYIFTKLLNI